MHQEPWIRIVSDQFVRNSSNMRVLNPAHFVSFVIVYHNPVIGPAKKNAIMPMELINP